MKRIKLIAIILIAFTTISYGATYSLVSANYPINVNGQKLACTPLNYNGTTYMPLRAVSEAVGVPIEWNNSTRSVEITTLDIDRLKEACVMIYCTNSTAWSQGSGVFVDYDTVLTAYHVIDGMTDIKINGTNFNVDAYDKQRDIAMLTADVHVKPVKIGDSDEINAGDPAIVIGYPGGGEIKVTNTKITHGGPPYMSLNQQVEKGTSGGPIFNSNGELIGIINKSGSGIKISTGTTINIIRETL